jgi:GT2 family glycosyltransferase
VVLPGPSQQSLRAAPLDFARNQMSATKGENASRRRQPDVDAGACTTSIVKMHPDRQTPCTTRATRAVVAIPVRDEAEWIGRCLRALKRQTRTPDAVVLLLNNCTDRTAVIACSLASRLPYRLHIHQHDFPSSTANVGSARRLAMEVGAEIAGPDGVLLTTDADAVVARDWIERSLLALASGADVVCGRVAIDPVEAMLIPWHVLAEEALERRLAELLDRVAVMLDPDPTDPWPRHTEAAGASLAVTTSCFNQVGGIPALAAGEDRAFVAALARMDARIRHDPTVTVTVSARIHGRAPGGMADTIRRRMGQQDEFADASLEPSVDAYRRIDFRRRVRLVWHDGAADEDLAADLGVPDDRLLGSLSNRFFGTAWAAIENQSPFLKRRRVRFAELSKQIAYAEQLLEPVKTSFANDDR